MSKIYTQKKIPQDIKFSTYQHMHMRKLLIDRKAHYEGIGRNSAQNSAWLGIVPTLIARVEDLIIQEPWLGY